MAITVNNEQGSTTKTLSYTPTSVTDSVLIVIPGSEDLSSDDPITAVDFGGTSLTLAVSGSGGPDSFSATQRCDIWYLINPGTSTLTITVTGGEAARTGLKAFTLGGVAQTSPVDTTDVQEWASVSRATETTTSTTVTDNCLVVSALCHSVAEAVNVTGATELVEVLVSSARLGSAHSTQTTAGTYSHIWSWNNATARGAVVSAAFKEAAAGSDRTATLTATLADIASSATATVDVDATLSTTLGALTLSSTGTVDVDATLSATLGELTLGSTGTVVTSGTDAALSAELGALTASSTGVVLIQATGSPQLAPMTSSSSTSVLVKGTGTSTLGALTLASTATLLTAPEIEGGTSLTINTNGGSLDLYFNGTDYFEVA